MRTDGNQPASTISIRAYLAGLAMQGFISGASSPHPEAKFWSAEDASEVSVRCADALIARLNKDDQDGLPKDE